MLSYEHSRASHRSGRSAESRSNPQSSVVSAFVPCRRAVHDGNGADLSRVAGEFPESRSAPSRRICGSCAPSMFLGVPRIWEKLHSSIHDPKLLEAGRVRRVLFERAYVACEPFAASVAKRSVFRRITFAIYYWLAFTIAEFHWIAQGARALTGAAPISPSVSAPPVVSRWSRFTG